MRSGVTVKLLQLSYITYICLSSIVNGKTIQKNSMLKCVGGIYVVSFGNLKRSIDYNFRLEFLILPSSGRLKPTCDKQIELQRLKNRVKKD